MNSKLILAVALMVVFALLFAHPAQGQGQLFPPAPPPPHGVCDTGGCTLVCHVAYHAGRHWLWVQDDTLEQWRTGRTCLACGCSE